MRKEVFFAIVAGISIGLLIAFGAWKVTQVIKKNRPSSVEKKNIPPQNRIDLSISNLVDYDIIVDSPFKLLGIARPNSDIIISTSEADFYKKSSEDGSFDIDVELPAGLSQILVGGKKLVAVYSSEFKKYLDEETPKEPEKTASDEAETKDSIEIIREKIKDEVSSYTLRRTAYTGTITDISSGTIQIKSVQGEIKQMSLNDDTTYINTLKNNVEIKSTDLAIGDYIVAMGFVNGNKVLDTKRILIGNPVTENKYQPIFGTISSISKTKLKINKENDEVVDITLPKKWVGPNISELEEGQKIITVGEFKDETYTLRTIFTPIE